MGVLLSTIVLLIALASPALGGQPLVVVQETHTRTSGGTPRTVERVATIKNTSARAVRAVRVTVEARDRAGRVRWRAVKRGPSSLDAGESAALSVTTPDLGPDATLVYRFDSRQEPRRSRSR